MNVGKVIQKQTLTFLSNRYSVLLLFAGAVLIIVSALQFSETAMEWSRDQYSQLFNIYHDNIAGKAFQNRMCLPMPIDAVYTWVNGSDPQLIEDLMNYKHTFEPTNDNANSSSSDMCKLENCVPYNYLVVDGVLSKNVTLDTLKQTYPALSAALSMFNLTLKTSHENVNPEAPSKEQKVTAMEFLTIEDVNKAVDTHTIIQVGSKNYTLSRGYLTTDGTHQKLVKLTNIVMAIGLGKDSTEEDVRKKVPETQKEFITKVDLRIPSSVAIITISNDGDLQTILTEAEKAEVDSEIKLVTAYLVWNLELEFDGDMSPNRFEDNEALRYSLRSLEKHAPWIRKVYIVTNGQIPAWLNLDNPRISLVAHSEIFLNQSHLPTFSSPAIESNIHRIKGLSDRFIYLNDDTMFGKDVWPDDFYTHAGGQKVYLTWPVPNCAEGCPSSWIKDNYCDKACNTSECDWDGGDCEGVDAPGPVGGAAAAAGGDSNLDALYCSSGCANSWIADKYCDTACNNLECGYDAGDCGTTNFGNIFSETITGTRNITLPKGLQVAYFNVTPIFGKTGSIEEGYYQPNNVVRASTIAQIFKTVHLLLFKNFTETTVVLKVTGKSADGGHVEVTLRVTVDTRPVKETAVGMLQKDILGSNQTHHGPTEAPYHFPDISEQDRKPLIDIQEEQNVVQVPEVADELLSDEIKEQIAELDKMLEQGDLTEKGYNLEKAHILEEYIHSTAFDDQRKLVMELKDAQQAGEIPGVGEGFGEGQPNYERERREHRELSDDLKEVLAQKRAEKHKRFEEQIKEEQEKLKLAGGQGIQQGGGQGLGLGQGMEAGMGQFQAGQGLQQGQMNVAQQQQLQQQDQQQLMFHGGGVAQQGGAPKVGMQGVPQQVPGQQVVFQQGVPQNIMMQQGVPQQVVGQQGAPQQMMGQQGIPQQVVGQQGIPQQMVGQQGVPQQVVGQQGVPQQVVGQQGIPQQIMGQQGAPQQVVGLQGIPQQMVGQQGVPQQVVGQQGVPQQVVGQQGVPQQMMGQQGVPQQVVGQQGVPQQMVGQQGVPQQVVGQQGVPQQVVGQQGVPQQIMERQGVPQQVVGQQGVPQQVVGQQGVPQQIMERQGVPQQVVGQQGVPQQVVGQQGVPQQVVGQQGVPQQVAGQQVVPQQAVGQQGVPQNMEQQLDGKQGVPQQPVGQQHGLNLEQQKAAALPLDHLGQGFQIPNVPDINFPKLHQNIQAKVDGKRDDNLGVQDGNNEQNDEKKNPLLLNLEDAPEEEDGAAGMPNDVINQVMDGVDVPGEGNKDLVREEEGLGEGDVNGLKQDQKPAAVEVDEQGGNKRRLLSVEGPVKKISKRGIEGDLMDGESKVVSSVRKKGPLMGRGKPVKMKISDGKKITKEEKMALFQGEDVRKDSKSVILEPLNEEMVRANEKYSREHSFLPWERTDLFSNKSSTRNEEVRVDDYENLKHKSRKLMDTYGNSLRYVNKLYNKRFGFVARKVPAHMVHMVDVNIMNELQAEFPKEFDLTSSHRIRHSQDMQFSFSYMYYMMSTPKEVNASEVFDEFDTDSSGILSDREIRTLATRLYELPLDLQTLTSLENTIINCSKYFKEDSEVDPELREEYYVKEMPQVTKNLMLHCGPIIKKMESSVEGQTKHKFEIMGEEEIAFKMIRTNVSHVIGQLDDVRKNPKKFVCLNDNINHNAEGAKMVKAVLQDYYEAMFPIPSQFELPREYRNRFLHIDELAEWKVYRDWLRFWTHVSLAALVLFSVATFCSNQLVSCKRRCCGRRRRHVCGEISERVFHV